jgi:3-deoxy-D-manno-octulosonic-acid transferase
MRALYNILAYMSMPFIIIRLWLKSRRLPEYRQHIAQRFSFIQQVNGCIWVHAVSLGESIAAVPIIEKLLQRYPGAKVLVTNMTPTGRGHIQRVFSDKVYNCYLPYDIPVLVKRFLNATKPKLAIIMETELWPNYLRQCHKRGIPIMLANARLSQRSAKGYARFSSFARAMFNELSCVAAQAQVDGQRFLDLGLAKEKLHITGSVKFDIKVTEKELEKGKALRKFFGRPRQVWVAASTHPGEEAQVLLAHQALLKKFPDALLVLVPRHPDRFDEVALLLEKHQWSFVRRTQEQQPNSETQVYLADTLGEMMAFYAAGDIAFVAGSFKAIGGHNVLEPAALAKPVVTGPELFNFQKATDLLRQAHAMKVVSDEVELARVLCELFESPEAQRKLGVAALDVVEANRGALDKQFALIERFLG